MTKKALKLNKELPTQIYDWNKEWKQKKERKSFVIEFVNNLLVCTTLYVAIYFVVSECNESAILLDWVWPRFSMLHCFNPNVLIKCLRLTFAYVFSPYLNYIHFVRFVWWLKAENHLFVWWHRVSCIVHRTSYCRQNRTCAFLIFCHFPHFLFCSILNHLENNKLIKCTLACIVLCNFSLLFIFFLFFLLFYWHSFP